ncbi:hypothetical protein BC833DRAFT_602225 [Globomyces pollinis-pini]|nr:hypothetical protein BC833DRAFT_602225 [Globomyces pollinis-pini]
MLLELPILQSRSVSLLPTFSLPTLYCHAPHIPHLSLADVHSPLAIVSTQCKAFLNHLRHIPSTNKLLLLESPIPTPCTTPKLPFLPLWELLPDLEPRFEDTLLEPSLPDTCPILSHLTSHKPSGDYIIPSPPSSLLPIYGDQFQSIELPLVQTKPLKMVNPTKFDSTATNPIPSIQLQELTIEPLILNTYFKPVISQFSIADSIINQSPDSISRNYITIPTLATPTPFFPFWKDHESKVFGRLMQMVDLEKFVNVSTLSWNLQKHIHILTSQECGFDSMYPTLFKCDDSKDIPVEGIMQKIDSNRQWNVDLKDVYLEPLSPQLPSQPFITITKKFTKKVIKPLSPYIPTRPLPVETTTDYFNPMEAVHYHLYLQGRPQLSPKSTVPVRTLPTHTDPLPPPINQPSMVTTLVDQQIQDLIQTESLKQHRYIASIEFLQNRGICTLLESLGALLIERSMIGNTLIISCRTIIILLPFQTLFTLTSTNLLHTSQTTIGQYLLTLGLHFTRIILIFENKVTNTVKLYPFTKPIQSALKNLHGFIQVIMKDSFATDVMISFSCTDSQTALLICDYGISEYQSTDTLAVYKCSITETPHCHEIFLGSIPGMNSVMSQIILKRWSVGQVCESGIEEFLKVFDGWIETSRLRLFYELLHQK